MTERRWSGRRWLALPLMLGLAVGLLTWGVAAYTGIQAASPLDPQSTIHNPRSAQAQSTPVVLQEGAQEDDNAVYVVAWSPDGKQIASAHYGGRIKIWNASGGAPVRTI